MKHLLFLFCIVFSQVAFAQETEKPTIYHPEANAGNDIKEAVSKAAASNKHVLLQIGGNWCVWCVRFHNLVNSDTTLSRMLEENYIVLHVNYSKENKNEKVLEQLGYPQRFGFPVFVVLDAKGNRIHTQNSAYLEEGQGHSKKKVEEFLKQWSPKALDPKNYKK